MLLNYSRPNVHTIAFRSKANLEAHKDTPMTMCPVTEITIMPGLNEVEDKLWESAKNANPHGIKILIAKRDIREYAGDPLKMGNFSELLESCVDEKLLTKYQKLDARDEVQTQIKLQFKKLADGLVSENETNQSPAEA